MSTLQVPNLTQYEDCKDADRSPQQWMTRQL